MAETLTESFCERCGTRYTIETPKERSSALTGVRVLGKGLRKLALTRASSLDEAISSARADDERQAAARQLEAFHGTFRFCLACRQYTCPDCWNDPAGVCLSCEPTPESQAAAALEVALSAEVAAAALRSGNHPAPVDAGPRPDWPTEDRRRGELAEEPDAAWLHPAGSGTGEASTDQPTIESHTQEPVDDGELGANPLLRAFQPGTNLDDAIAAYEAAADSARQLEPERQPVAATGLEAAPEPEPVEGRARQPEPEPEAVPVEPGPEPGPVAVAREPEPGQVAPEPELVAAEPEPELVAAEPEPEPVTAEPEPELLAAEPQREPVAADMEPEPEVVAPEPEPEPEPVAADMEPEPEVVAPEPEPEPEPVAAATEAEPELVAAAPEPELRPERAAAIELVVDRAPAPVAAAPAAPVIEPGQPPDAVAGGPQAAPATPPVAMPAPATEAGLRPAAAAQPSGEGAFPQHSAGEDPRFSAWRIMAPEMAASVLPSPDALPPISGAGFAARMGGSGPATQPTSDVRGHSATRARPQVGAHGCISCGLSLSANARFCRRCGTRQG